MINPNKIYSGRGRVTEVPKGLYQTYTVTLENGGKVYGYDLPERFKVGDKVTVQCQYSITAEKYMVIKNGIRKARVVRDHSEEYGQWLDSQD